MAEYTDNGTTYVSHTFDANLGESLVIAGAPAGFTVDALIVAGGGGGSESNIGGAGGGAGGMQVVTGLSVSNGNYAASVGSGGAGAPNADTSGVSGGNSSIFGLTSVGGGGGGARMADGLSGGSGGGSTFVNQYYLHLSVGGSGTPGQGNEGARGWCQYTGQWCGNGAGGAGGGAALWPSP